MFENVEKLIVVVGCQRSGTTLTGQILGAHPQCILIDEKDGLYKWYESYENKLSNIETFQKMLVRADRKYSEIEKRTKPISRTEGRSDSCVLSSNVTTLVLKAPNLTYSFQSLAQFHIPVYVIYPIRDPRAVVSSMGKLGHIPFVENQIQWLTKNSELVKRFDTELKLLKSDTLDVISKRAIVWRIKSGLTSDFTNAGLPTFTFNYEELIGDSHTVVAKLARFSKLDFHHSMLAHENIYHGYGPGGTERFRSIDQKSLTGWKDTLSSSSISTIERAARPLFESSGYGS